jgi:hypothetical protein
LQIHIVEIIQQNTWCKVGHIPLLESSEFVNAIEYGNGYPKHGRQSLNFGPPNSDSMYNERNSTGFDRTYQALSREGPGFGTGNNQFNHPPSSKLTVGWLRNLYCMRMLNF